MSAGTAPCDDCGRPVPVPDGWPVDWAYCASCRADNRRLTAPVADPATEGQAEEGTP